MLTLRVTIPANATATVYVPAQSPSSVTENSKPVSKAKDISFLRMEEGAAVFRLACGTYQFAGPTAVSNTRTSSIKEPGA